MEEILKHYEVSSLEDLKKLLLNKDPKVEDLREFIMYYLLQEEEIND